MSEQQFLPLDEWQKLQAAYRISVEPPATEFEFPEAALRKLIAINPAEAGRLEASINQLIRFTKLPIVTDNLQQLFPETEQVKVHDIRRLLRDQALPPEQRQQVKQNKLRINHLGLIYTSSTSLADSLELLGSEFAALAAAFNQLADDFDRFRNDPEYSKQHPDQDPYNRHSDADKRDFALKVDQTVRRLLTELVAKVQ